MADQHNATIATYGYDPFGRRIWKEVHGQRTYFHYSEQGLVAELDATGTLLKSYGYKPGNPWGTDPLYVRQGGKNHWYLTDHLGTPQQIVAENGAVVWQAQYAVFGKAEVDAGSSITNNLRFPGQYYDAETGLHYNWNRYYDPETGRYTQTDPIGFKGGDFNLYGYSQNNPIVLYDEYGLMAGCIPPNSPNYGGVDTQCYPSAVMVKCLSKIFGVSESEIKNVNIYNDSHYAKSINASARTARNVIALGLNENGVAISCQDFFNDSFTVLEEYYHVLFQWNTGRLGSDFEYLWDSITSKGDSYDDNPWEIEAKYYAQSNRFLFLNCLCN